MVMQYIEETYPFDSLVESAGLPRPISVSRIPHSTSTINFEVRLPDRAVLLRFYQGGDPEYEFRLMTKIRKAGIPVPEQIHYEQGTRRRPPFVIMEFIEGEEMVTAVEKDDELVDQYVDRLRQIHEYKWQRSGLDIKKYYPKPSSFAKALVKRRQGENRRLRLRKQCSELTKWLKDRAKEVTTENYAQLHGDYHPYNIIVRDGVLHIVDWEGAEIGDPRYDLGFAAVALGVMGGKDAEERALRRYSDELPDMDFFTVSGTMHRVTKLFRMYDQLTEVHKQAYHYMKDRTEEIAGRRFGF